MSKIEQENLEIKQVEPEKIDDIVEGFSLTGDILDTIKDKSVEILEWRKETFKDIKDETKEVRKAVLSVKLSNGAIMDYFPNKTSLKSLMAKFGVAMSDWVGKTIKLEVLTQPVGDGRKKVIYVEDASN